MKDVLIFCCISINRTSAGVADESVRHQRQNSQWNVDVLVGDISDVESGNNDLTRERTNCSFDCWIWIFSCTVLREDYRKPSPVVSVVLTTSCRWPIARRCSGRSQSMLKALGVTCDVFPAACASVGDVMAQMCRFSLRCLDKRLLMYRWQLCQEFCQVNSRLIKVRALHL